MKAPIRVGVLSFAHYHANFWTEVFRESDLQRAEVRKSGRIQRLCGLEFTAVGIGFAAAGVGATGCLAIAG